MKEESTRRVTRVHRGLPAFIAIVAMLCGGDRMRAAVPADFNDTLVASVAYATALAFTPDGRLLIATQTGSLRVFQNGTLLSTPALTLGSAKVCTNSERGLLGVAVDPAFASNGYIYLYYTSNTNSCVNRVSRFMLPTNNIIDVSTEVRLIDNIYAPYGNHNGGYLQVGKDGYLYISVGDGAMSYTARDLSKLNGKILRINIPNQGGIPSTNPYQGAGTAPCALNGGTSSGTKCQEIFASGLRNPFRMSFDPNASGTRFYINDVGQNTWEEIDLGSSGADYGWDVREGHCANGSTSNCGSAGAMTNPVYDYGRSAGCGAITGGAFVPNGVWPSTYNGAYLFSDYLCGTIFKLSSSNAVSNFGTSIGSAVAMTFGPYNGTQALYYTNFASGGQVRRIAYTGSANRPPVAAATASPASGPTPLNVNFDGSGSSDPDGNPMTYDWDFGDGTPHATTVTASHTYNNAAVYTARLTVRDNLQASGTTTVQIDAGNTAPMPTIVSPSASTTFRVGQTMTLQGQATDTQDGTLADNRLSWVVIRHHATHIHPYLPPTTGNNVSFTMPSPEDFLAASNSYLEIQLTATDMNGLSATVAQDLRPNMVNVTFNTQPAGLHVDVNGTALTSQTVVSWEGYVLNASAPTQMDSNGQWWTFASWSDSGSSSHAITTPASAATYTATFTQTATPAGPSAVFVGPDTTTKGSWSGVYGHDGYAIVNDATSYPTYAQVTMPVAPSAWTWQSSTTDVRALQRASSSGRIAAVWHQANTFTLDINLTPGTTRQVALYAVDWDSTMRAQRFDLLDADTGAILDTRTQSGFNGGGYLVWNLSGHVSIRVTRTAGANAVVSGLFFDTPGSAPPPAATAAFVREDATTKGDWSGVYGHDGYATVNDATSYPSYGQWTPSGPQSYTWQASSTDARALKRASGSGRIAAAWYQSNTFTIDVNLTPGPTHQVALYSLDWDSTSRGQRIDIIDTSTGTVLNSRTLSGFNGGKYLVWTVSGHVTIRVTRTAGANAVVSGIFFD